VKGVFKKRGNWYIDYYLANGRRKREKIGPSQKLAQKVLNKRKTQVAEDKFLDIEKVKRVKLGEFADRFIENYCKPNKTSWKDDKERLAKLAGFLGVNKLLDEITSYDIEKFKGHRLQQGIKVSTVNRYLAILKTMFNKAIEWGNAKDNPVRKVKFFKENNERTRFLEKEEIERLLNASSPYLKDVIITALNTGLRYSEIFSLKWSDMDFRNNLVFIHKTKNKEKRIIPMNTPLKRVFVSRREHSAVEFVFPKKCTRESFKKTLERAIIKDFKFHDLRHTYASYLVMNGVDLMTVKELLGHKTIKMTLRYAHLSQDHKMRAAEVLGQQMDTIWTPGRKLPVPEEIESSLTLSHSIS